MMRTTLAVGLAVAAVLGAFALAPGVRAQGRDRVVTPGIQLPMLQEGRGAAIGASVREVGNEEAEAAGLPPGGVVVEEVREDGPAADAGLRRGDLVVDFDGERVRGARHFVRLVRETPPGRLVAVTIVRDGQRWTIQVAPRAGEGLAQLLPDLGRRLERGIRAMPREFELDLLQATPRRRLGVTLVPLSDQLASHFGVGAGVLVSEVVAGSAAAQAGIRAGDVITAIGGEPVEDPRAATERVGAAAHGEAVEIRLVRGRQPIAVTATMPEVAEPPRARIRI